MKEYGNTICFVSVNEIPTQTELDMVTRMLEHNFLQHAAEYSFPVDAQPEILQAESQKFLTPHYIDSGEPCPVDYSFGLPSGSEMRWNGKYIHYFAWHYVLEAVESRAV